MNITYVDPGCAHSIESLSLFLTGEQTPFWSEPILFFYPQVDKQKIMNVSGREQKQYLQDVFGSIYENVKEEFYRKAVSYNAHFQLHKEQIEEVLSDAFCLDAGALFNDLTGNITLNPICPRYLKERNFDVFYLNSERGALGLSLHEVIHYFWFHVWNDRFGDSY